MKRRRFIAGAVALSVTRTHANEKAALSGSRFTIGGDEFLLADVAAPPLYHLRNQQPAYFENARKDLSRLLRERIEISEMLPRNRWGVQQVKVTTGATTFQEKLVSRGSCRVLPQSDDHEFIRVLLALEAQARTAKRGLWAFPEYKLISADNAYPAIGDYALVEGTPQRAAKYGSRFFLNFDEDFRSDFTATATSARQRKWAKAGIDLTEYEGRKIRVRGWVEAINGPSIDLQHPLQIEVLDG
ncbi:thermonuclease family protein [Hyphococcus lacteus]|uniref:Thermonuclease family protein n=1 Tax=Hyphococcus lacteus TaxID=3143536 RepID=A0ABV3Z566_9PROT